MSDAAAERTARGTKPAAPGGPTRSWIPGLDLVRHYRREWPPSDVVAGVSVAAVALPIGIAYARLAGFPPVVGIYSAILPAVAYALFGSSRQLVVNPDSAACAIVAATLAPLAASGTDHYADLSIALTLLTGLLCIGGGLLGFGVIANFLSRPILTGYLNGIALSIIAGQLGTILGFPVPHGGFFRTVANVAAHLRETHGATLTIGAALFVVLRGLKRLAPRVPAPLVAAALGIAAVELLGLDRQGVAVVGPVPAGFPPPRIPALGPGELTSLLSGACGIVLVSFCSMMTTARGFAAKNHYAIDSNRDMIALGISDMASGLSHGFVVSGADSRTAVADASGGKSQLATIVAAATMALVLLFLTAPLAKLPNAALGAILISSAIGLFDLRSLRTYWRLSRPEFRHSVVAMLGVMTIGVLSGVLIAVGLALLRLLREAARPHDAILGLVEGSEREYRSEARGGRPIPGLLIYRLDGPLLFFNADRFKERILESCAGAEPPARWFLFDVEGVPLLDLTGADALQALHAELTGRGVEFAIARSKGPFNEMLERTGLAGRIGPARLFSSIHEGVAAFLQK